MKRSTRFILVRPRDPNNIGAVARAMANFGLKDLVVVEPYAPVWREARSAVGAAQVLREARSLPRSEALSGATLVLGTCGSRRRLRSPLLDLPALGAFLNKHLSRGEILAVLFGSEKTGLTAAELGHCHAVVRIPTSPRSPSMNLGQAAALVAYELSRASRPGRVQAPGFSPAPAEQLEALVSEFLRAFAALDYMQGVPLKVQARRVRGAMLRLKPCRKDAGLLLAVLRRAGRSAA